MPFRWHVGLRRLAWLIEVRGLADRSDGSGRPCPVDKSDGIMWEGLARACR